jgi:rRNA biogenesis protein RRP5
MNIPFYLTAPLPSLARYAVCEFDVGSEDRGRSVFEELVGSYPKRTDLWHVYVDKEVKSGNHLQARQLFERMVASRSSAKAMKAAFKKFLSFEQLHGSPEQQEAVKTKAREYVSSIM